MSEVSDCWTVIEQALDGIYGPQSTHRESAWSIVAALNDAGYIIEEMDA